MYRAHSLCIRWLCCVCEQFEKCHCDNEVKCSLSLTDRLHENVSIVNHTVNFIFIHVINLTA